MRRCPARVAWCLAALAGMAQGARAQIVGFQLAGTDTLLAIPIGRTLTADLYLNSCTSVSEYSITLLIDNTRVRVLDADSVLGYGFPSPTIQTAPGEVTLTMTGGSPADICSPFLARIYFEMDAGAAEGTLVSVRLNTLLNAGGADLRPPLRTQVLSICQAVRMWGDLDSTFTVTSRDALITLTTAVGLPIPGGFIRSVGDVDADGDVTTRDALYLLSHGIGLGGVVRPGLGVPNRCAPLAPVPNDLVFIRNSNLYRVLQGDTLPALRGTSTTFEPGMAWAPDGSRVAFSTSVTGFGEDIVLFRSDGSRTDSLRLDVFAEVSPAWSPDGTRLAFVSNRVGPQSIFLVDADGANQVRLTTTHTVIDIAWSPDGTRLAFTGYSVCCTIRLWAVNADGSNLVEVFPNSNTHVPGRPVWSPGSDSIAYVNQSLGRIYKVQATGSTTGVPVSPLNGFQESPAWSSAGIVFVTQVGSFVREEGFLVRNTDGRNMRLTRDDFVSTSRLALRPASIYVTLVQIAPANAALDLVVGPQTRQFTPAVTNSDGNPNVTVPHRWTSRNPAVVSVDGTGLATAQGVGSAYVVLSVRGWRSDSALVTVTSTDAGPPPAGVRR